MEVTEFDKKFQELLTSLVEASYELVGNNVEEVDRVYIYASTEQLNSFFNVFYKINGRVEKIKNLNHVSKKQYDLSRDTIFGLLRYGGQQLLHVIELFQEDNREIPTLMKITYDPKTEAFNTDIIYEPQYSNHPERTNMNGFFEWFEEMKEKDS